MNQSVNEWASLVEERSWIDPDSGERSRNSVLSVLIFWDKKNFNPSRFSHVTKEFVCKQTVISFDTIRYDSVAYI